MSKLKIFSLIVCLTIILSATMFSLVYFTKLFPLKYIDEIKECCVEYNLDPSLVASLINEESSFRTKCVSSSGAVGLMQLMPKTAEWVATKMKKQNFEIGMLFYPKNNIDLGTYYLNYLKDKFVDIFTVLCAYNAGEGLVSLWLKDSKYSIDGKTLKSTPFRETNIYVKKVLENQKRYKTRLQFFS